MFNVSRPTILRWLGLYEIEKRDHSKATEIVTSNQTGRQRKGYEEAHKQLDDYDWLMDQRVNQKKSIRRIAKELDVSYTLVKKYLRKYEFEIGERVDRVPIETIKKLKNKSVPRNRTCDTLLLKWGPRMGYAGRNSETEPTPTSSSSGPDDRGSKGRSATVDCYSSDLSVPDGKQGTIFARGTSVSSPFRVYGARIVTGARKKCPPLRLQGF